MKYEKRRRKQWEKVTVIKWKVWINRNDEKVERWRETKKRNNSNGIRRGRTNKRKKGENSKKKVKENKWKV